MDTNEQAIRVEFARQANLIFSGSLRDEDRKAYWAEVLEPIWQRLLVEWAVFGLSARDGWETAIRHALVPALPPAEWRARKWKAKADKHAAAKVAALRAKRKRREEASGVRDREDRAYTRAFLQGQSFGAASPVVSIDPSTYNPDNS